MVLHFCVRLREMRYSRQSFCFLASDNISTQLKQRNKNETERDIEDEMEATCGLTSKGRFNRGSSIRYGSFRHPEFDMNFPSSPSPAFHTVVGPHYETQSSPHKVISPTACLVSRPFVLNNTIAVKARALLPLNLSLATLVSQRANRERVPINCT